MEDGLVLFILLMLRLLVLRLNPCCNGRWSRTLYYCLFISIVLVLILVVMEDGLVLDLIRLY